MKRFARFNYQPSLPLGKNGKFVTNSKAHWAISKQGAVEGTVLLKNDGTLPLPNGTKLCLFGSGIGEFLFCGGGSGGVHTDKKVTLADALRNAEKAGRVEVFSPLVEHYLSFAEKEYVDARAKFNGNIDYWRRERNIRTPDLPDDLYEQAKNFGGTAIFCIARYSSEGTDCGDRNGLEGDFDLWANEKELLGQLCRDFQQVIVILNVCGPVSVKEYKHNNGVGAVLYAPFGGSLAGEALADILLGDAYPSGKLQDTLANDLYDYPGTEQFLHNNDYQNYTEDIFVGYRYFETFAPEKVAYPFGFGLGYTKFDIKATNCALENSTVKLTVSVTNSGCFKGKEVVQAYLEAPQGKLGKAKRVLCAFAKTKELKPGETTILNLHFSIRDFGSFDDLGKVYPFAFVLEKGSYGVWVGSSVRDVKRVLNFTLDEDILCKKCHGYMAPRNLPERLTADGTMEELPELPFIAHKPVGYRLRNVGGNADMSLQEALESDRFDEFLESQTDETLVGLLYGHPNYCVANTGSIGFPAGEKWRTGKIPAIPTADGPAGVRVVDGCGIKTTCFPSATAIAQTWNLKLTEKIGVAIAREMKENNAGIWLAPGMNIHRHPLCGRNFEYYSEDPLATGLLAAACVKGVQSQRIGATIKHFCTNNREINRKYVDSRVSQRALREIYLRGFEIAVKKGKPLALMTAYNPVNGVQSSTNWEAINGILRGEWGFDGIVMTDWWAFSNIEDEIHAGSDVKMPEMITQLYPNANKTFDPVQAIKDGTLDRGAVLASARRIFKMIDFFE